MSHIMVEPTDGGAVNDCGIGDDTDQIAWLDEDDLTTSTPDKIDVTTFRDQLFAAINKARAANGHPNGFTRTSNLDACGQDRCSTAVANNTVPASGGFSSWFMNHIHDSYVSRQASHGVSKPDHAEIALWQDGATPKQCVNIYLNSPPHRAIVLGSESLLQYIGVGVRYARANDGSETRVINVCDLAGD